jgi:hypothetical protein
MTTWDMLPNFLIIGAARSGTSTLYTYMQSHPDIYLRPEKRPEPHFFFKDSEYAKGMRYYETTWFPIETKCHAVGEASTSYIFGPKVPERIARDLPDARLIAVLRNPIERAHSNYWHSVKSGLETLDFASAVEREDQRTQALNDTALAELKPFSYLARGFYHAQISKFLTVIPHGRLAIHIFDDLCRDPRGQLEEIYRFIGVDPGILPARLDLKENRSVPDGARLDAAMRRRLANIYADDVTRLGELLGRDLSGWLRSDLQ